MEDEMKKIKAFFPRFTLTDTLIWITSAGLILLSFFLFDGESYLTLAASLVGVTSLIFNAKGNPTGQILMLAFSVMYSVISFSFSYYGEMMTYLGMTAPMAVFSLVSWLRHPFEGNKAEVTVAKLQKGEVFFMFALSAAVTAVFWFILDAFDTANMIPSTVSVTTSFLAAYLTFRRSSYFSLAYAANDVVLIVLWVMASFENVSYVSVVICFAVFLANDLYAFISWEKMKKRQHGTSNNDGVGD